jgi:hypothetical protein
MPSSVVLAHRVFHSQDRAAPDVINWQQAVPLANAHQHDGPLTPQDAQVDDLVSLLHQPPDENFSLESCRFCREQSYPETQAAEQSAKGILKEVIPSLTRVEWMNWFTPRHLGVSTHVYNSG